jgi:hypothetical protein
VRAQSVQRWATGWTIGVLGFDSRRGLGICFFITASRTALGPIQPPIQWVPGAFYLGVKRPGRESDHSPPSSAEVKNAWSYISTPQYAFVAWCLVKITGTLTLLLPFTSTILAFNLLSYFISLIPIGLFFVYMTLYQILRLFNIVGRNLNLGEEPVVAHL